MSKTALITGASSGIGKELAKIHASKGGDLVIVARREEQLTALKMELEQSYSVKVEVIVKDLSQQDSAKEIYDAVKSKGIEVDYLINNAGFGGRGFFYERNWEKDLAMINVNVVALTALTRYFLPDFVKRNSGKILNVSSTASLVPGPLQAVYYATKAYVTSFSNALAGELVDTNITVTALLPGATATEFGSTSGMDKTSMFLKMFTAEEVALTGYRGMLRGGLDVYAGLSLGQRIMMAMAPLLPKKMVMKQIFEIQKVSE